MPSFTDVLSTRQNASKARLPALYADFRPLKQHNPEGYAANIKVWQSALASALTQRVLSSQSSLVLEVTSLLQEELSSPPWGRPLGLGSVVTESVAAGEWIPLEQFLNESISIYEQSWSVTGAISWMWRRLVEYSAGSADDDPLPAGRFVLKRNVEEAANKILKKVGETSSPYVDYIYSPQTFAETFSPLFPERLSKLDQLLLLKYLSRDKHEISCSPTTIKFRASDKKLTPITESDASIANLKSVQLTLTQQIALLTNQSIMYSRRAKQATIAKNRTLALSALKSRRLTESALQKRTDALAQIESVLNSVEQSASDAEVLRALEGGAKALERANKEVGGIERVEAVMERVREGVEMSEEVGRAISETGVSVDEDEVMEEFEEMLKGEEERKKAVEEVARKERERKPAAEEAARESVQSEEERKTSLEERHDGLVEELKNVSLKAGDKDHDMEGLEEAIPA